MMEKYFIDETGIYFVKSTSYPDQVWHEHIVNFGVEDPQKQLDKFVTKLRREGQTELQSMLRGLLGARGF